MHFLLVIVLSLHVGYSLRSSDSKHGSHNLLKLENSNSSVQRQVRCTPCEQDVRRPVSNHLDPEYRGNGADNLGYDWSAMAWGGPAFPRRSKVYMMGMRGRDGRMMTNDRGMGQGNVKIICDTCRSYWDGDRGGSRGRQYDMGGQSNYGGQSWQRDGMRLPADFETRVMSPTVGVLVKPGSRIAYIPSRSGEMYWDGVSGGGTRWDGFSNGISWIGNAPAEWDRSDSEPRDASGTLRPGSDYPQGSNTFGMWNNQNGQSNWRDNPGRGYYFSNGVPNDIDSQMRDKGYASNWHYGSTDQNGWNGNSMKWNYGGKQWTDNDRAANRFYFNSPQDRTIDGHRQYGNQYPNYQPASGYPDGFRLQSWPNAGGYRPNDRFPASFQGNYDRDRPWEYTSRDPFGYRRPGSRPEWARPGPSYPPPGNFGQNYNKPGSNDAYDKYSPSDRNDFERPWNRFGYGPSKPSSGGGFPYGGGNAGPSYPAGGGHLFYPVDDNRQPGYAGVGPGPGETRPSKPGDYPNSGNQVGSFSGDKGRPDYSGDKRPSVFYMGGRPLGGYPGGGSSSGGYPGDGTSSGYGSSSGGYPGGSPSTGYPSGGRPSSGYPSGGSSSGGYPVTEGSSGGYPSGGVSGTYPDGGRPSGYPGSSTVGGSYPSGGSRPGGSYPSEGNRPGGSYPSEGSRPGGSYPSGGSRPGGSYPLAGNRPGGSYPSEGGRPDGSYPSGGSQSGGSYPSGGNRPGGSYPSEGSRPGGSYPSGGSRPGGSYPSEGSRPGGSYTGGSRPDKFYGSGDFSGGYPSGGSSYPRPGSSPYGGGGSLYPSGGGRPDEGYPNSGYFGSSRPTGYPTGGRPGGYGGGDTRPEEYPSGSRPGYPIRGSYPGSGGSGGGYPTGDKNPPKGYYTGFITELGPDNSQIQYGGKNPNYFGGSYPGDKTFYPGKDRDKYFGSGSYSNGYPSGDKNRYPAYSEDRYSSGGGDGSFGGYSPGDNDRGRNKYYYGQSDGKGKPPVGYPSNHRYPGSGGDDFDRNQGSSSDKNSWNYGQNEHKEGIYRRSGGSYPPYRGGQYYTSSYLASMSTTAGSTQAGSEQKTQSITKTDEVTQPTSDS